MIYLRLLISGCLSFMDASIEDHLSLFYSALELYATKYKHENVIMKLFSSSLIENFVLV
jgi:hypothetical protein